jgi:HEAT repeat protein
VIPRLKRILLGLVVACAICAAALWVLVHTLGSREPLYQNHPAEYWFGLAGSGNPSTSNKAVTVFATLMIPQLTQTMFRQAEDSKLRLALIEELNSLAGIHIAYMPAEARRLQAVDQLGQMGPLAASAVPELVRALKSDDPPLRAEAATSLGRIHSEPQTIIPLLMAGLDDSSGSVRAAAAGALAEYGPLAKAAVPKLVPLLKTQDKDLRRATSVALRQIDPAAAEQAGVK